MQVGERLTDVMGRGDEQARVLRGILPSWSADKAFVASVREGDGSGGSRMEQQEPEPRPSNPCQDRKEGSGVSLSERMLDLDERFGVPRDAQGVHRQSVRYWWVYLALAEVTFMAGVAMYLWNPLAVVGPMTIVPGLAFAGGFFYAHRLRELGKRSALFDHGPEPSLEDQTQAVR